MTKASIVSIERALRKNAGLLSMAAADVGITRSAIHHRITSNPRLQAVLAEIEETRMDQAEGVIVDALNKKDKATARWYAERKGKARGYGNATSLRLDDDQLEAMISAADPATLRKLAGGA